MEHNHKIDSSYRTVLYVVSKLFPATGMKSDANDHNPSDPLLKMNKAFGTQLAPQAATGLLQVLERFISRFRRWRNIVQGPFKAFPYHFKEWHISKYFVDVSDTEIEVFGQFANCDHAKPTPDRLKNVQFGFEIQVVHRS